MTAAAIARDFGAPRQDPQQLFRAGALRGEKKRKNAENRPETDVVRGRAATAPPSVGRRARRERRRRRRGRSAPTAAGHRAVGQAAPLAVFRRSGLLLVGRRPLKNRNVLGFLGGALAASSPRS